MMEWVERFYDEYYFRPKAAWRIIGKAIFDGPERKRLYKEAREYMALRRSASSTSKSRLRKRNGRRFSARGIDLSARASKTRTLVLVAAVIILNAVGNLSLAWG